MRTTHYPSFHEVHAAISLLGLLFVMVDKYLTSVRHRYVALHWKIYLLPLCKPQATPGETYNATTITECVGDR